MSELNALEEQRKGFKAMVDRREQALRLFKNKDFKSLIMEYFMVEECARYTHTSVNLAIDKESREDALRFAQSSAFLKQFLSVVVQMGNSAENQMESLDEAIVEAAAEEDEQTDLIEEGAE